MPPEEALHVIPASGSSDASELVSYRLTPDAFCKKSDAIEMPQCHPAHAVMA
jgi:hypothetical protein